MFGFVTKTRADMMVLKAKLEVHDGGCSKSWDQNAKDLGTIREAINSLSDKLSQIREEVNAKHSSNRNDYFNLRNRIVLGSLLLLLAVFANGKGLDVAKMVLGF